MHFPTPTIRANDAFSTPFCTTYWCVVSLLYIHTYIHTYIHFLTVHVSCNGLLCERFVCIMRVWAAAAKTLSSFGWPETPPHLSMPPEPPSLSSLAAPPRVVCFSLFGPLKVQFSAFCQFQRRSFVYRSRMNSSAPWWPSGNLPLA